MLVTYKFPYTMEEILEKIPEIRQKHITFLKDYASESVYWNALLSGYDAILQYPELLVDKENSNSTILVVEKDGKTFITLEGSRGSLTQSGMCIYTHMLEDLGESIESEIVKYITLEPTMSVNETHHDERHQFWVKCNFKSKEDYVYVLELRHGVRKLFMQYCLAVAADVDTSLAYNHLNNTIYTLERRQGHLTEGARWSLQKNSGLDTSGVKFDYYNGLDPIDKELAEKLVLANSKELYKSHYGHNTGWNAQPYEETEE